MSKKSQLAEVCERYEAASRETMVEKELLQASIVQRELVTELRALKESLGVLDQTLNLIKEHEFVELHSSKWKIFAYQIGLGMLFAFGTVFGLVFLSWMTYTFFKDSEVLRGVVDNQLKMRRLDFNEIKEKARTDATGLEQSALSGKILPSKTGSGTRK